MKSEKLVVRTKFRFPTPEPKKHTKQDSLTTIKIYSVISKSKPAEKRWRKIEEKIQKCKDLVDTLN